jgi:hypothetical protein
LPPNASVVTQKPSQGGSGDYGASPPSTGPSSPSIGASSPSVPSFSPHRVGGTRFSGSSKDFSQDVRTGSPGIGPRSGSPGDARTSSTHPRTSINSVGSSPGTRPLQPEMASRRAAGRSLSNASDGARHQRFAAGPDESDRGFRFPRTFKLTS